MKFLKDCEDFKRVYIAPDLTRKQQECDKDLREHVKSFERKGIKMLKSNQER